MRTWVALFRGINVGGSNVLPMKDLVACLEGEGCRDVETYIQSGNAVFRSEQGEAQVLARQIRAAIQKARGFDPHVVLLTVEALERAVAANPFTGAEAEPKTLHAAFLDTAPPDPDTAKLSALAAPGERFVLDGAVLYLHAPEGIGRSKLVAAVERCLGVPATMRNWRTVRELLNIAQRRKPLGAP